MKRRQLRLMCARCAGSGWLCDEHPDQPWGHDDDCDAGGIACRCNEMAAVPHDVVFVEHDLLEAPAP
ncbi:MAG: hypothetical protein HS128_01950 [Ideonella sp.]|nr:hypothetical protein [Ideonella sp.]MCC7458503.1 hypothetical protein [Nitrospira sp.]